MISLMVAIVSGFDSHAPRSLNAVFIVPANPVIASFNTGRYCVARDCN